MPVFRPPEIKNQVQSAPVEDSDIVNFLKPNGQRDYVSATDALKNSDIYSVVSQLSGDLATVQLSANMPRAQGILNNPSSTASGHALSLIHI